MRIYRTMLLLAVGVAAASCGPADTPTGPREPVALARAAADPSTSADTDATISQSGAPGGIVVCHRTGSPGSPHGYVRITVSESALPAHLSHGDGRVGDPVPGQAGMMFDDACVAVAEPLVVVTTGSFDPHGAESGPVTVPRTGAVHATATVTMSYSFTSPLRLQLRTYDPSSAPNPCGAPVLQGPLMSPTGPITAHWASVPAGTYCVVVVSEEFVAPFTWTVTVTMP